MCYNLPGAPRDRVFLQPDLVAAQRKRDRCVNRGALARVPALLCSCSSLTTVEIPPKSQLGTEIRAFNNMGWNRDAGGTKTEKIGLTGYGPK